MQVGDRWVEGENCKEDKEDEKNEVRTGGRDKMHPVSKWRCV